MFDPSSRYHALATSSVIGADGRPVAYVRRRFLPHGSRMQLLGQVIVQQGDRIDLVAARVAGDPEQFWRVADANDAMSPFDLTAETGRRLRVAAPEP
ncbi:MAG: hypothetical protein IT208_11545 [Chthonomonadales bacterium]|nr:hypothetical protein [Chthonomonadales bacterium]